MDIRTIAKQYITTMLQQIGGQHFIVMIGAILPILYSYNETKCEFIAHIHFKANNEKGINYLDLVYCEGMDTYRMEFYRLLGSKLTHIETCEDVYCDTLQSTFTSVTGLDTHL